jgi:hypothetical protein
MFGELCLEVLLDVKVAPLQDNGITIANTSSLLNTFLSV